MRLNGAAARHEHKVATSQYPTLFYYAIVVFAWSSYVPYVPELIKVRRFELMFS